MALEGMLGALSTSEKLEAMNILWRQLSEDSASLTSPDWHREVLADRLANPSPLPSISLDEAINNARERLHARRTQE